MLGTLAYNRILSLLTGLVHQMAFSECISQGVLGKRLRGTRWRNRQNVVWLWGAVTFAAGLDEAAMKLPSLVPTWSCKQGKGRRYHPVQTLLLQKRRRCEHASPAAGTVFRSRPSATF